MFLPSLSSDSSILLEMNYFAEWKVWDPATYLHDFEAFHYI